MSSITGANSVFTLAVTNLFDSPQYVQGYAADDAFKSDAVPQAEVLMGVDGTLSGGKVWAPYKMTIMLQADSPSIALFETWRTSQDAAVDVFIGQGTIFLPSINMQYTLDRGFLTSAMPFPDVKKLLQPIPYEITWNLITSSPTA